MIAGRLIQIIVLLGLLSFFTVGEDEVRAWSIPEGTRAQDAASAIHSDIARGFIRAEVVGYDDLIAAEGSMAVVRERGRFRRSLAAGGPGAGAGLQGPAAPRGRDLEDALRTGGLRFRGVQRRARGELL